MNKCERVSAALVGSPVDRLPYSFWYHFLDIPVEERAGERLAKAELQFYQTYDPDFLKVMHDVPYDLPEGMDKVESLEDWKKVRTLDPVKGNFGRQLEALRLIVNELNQETFVIDTVFNCFAYAERITGKKTMELLRENREAFHEVMKRVAMTLCDWAEATIQQGCAGIYLALQGASSDIMTEEEYRYEFLPYDHKVLSYVEHAARFNVVHLHGENLYWNIWEDLPFHALSWSSMLTPPTISEARKAFCGCVIGGVNERDIGIYSRERVKEEIRQAVDENGKYGMIAAPGCAVPTDCPPANLHAFREAAEEIPPPVKSDD